MESELIGTIRQGIDGAASAASEIGTRLLDCATRLRVEPTDAVFSSLSAEIGNLGQLAELVGQIRNGLSRVKPRAVPAGTFSSWDRSLEVFKEMLSAFERKDWVTVSDLIQYELHPLLTEGERALAALSEALARP